MEGLFVLGLLVVALAVFVGLTIRFGVDSRPELGDPQRGAPGLSI